MKNKVQLSDLIILLLVFWIENGKIRKLLNRIKACTSSHAMYSFYIRRRFKKYLQFRTFSLYDWQHC